MLVNSSTPRASSSFGSWDSIGPYQAIFQWVACVLQPARMDGRSLISGARRRRLLLEYWNEDDFDATPNWASVRGLNWQYVEWWPDDPAKKRSETLFGIPPDNVGKILEHLRSA